MKVTRGIVDKLLTSDFHFTSNLVSAVSLIHAGVGVTVSDEHATVLRTRSLGKDPVYTVTSQPLIAGFTGTAEQNIKELRLKPL